MPGFSVERGNGCGRGSKIPVSCEETVLNVYASCGKMEESAGHTAPRHGSSAGQLKIKGLACNQVYQYKYYYSFIIIIIMNALL